jgi:hypothetical protein
MLRGLQRQEEQAAVAAHRTKGTASSTTPLNSLRRLKSRENSQGFPECRADFHDIFIRNCDGLSLAEQT